MGLASDSVVNSHPCITPSAPYPTHLPPLPPRPPHVAYAGGGCRCGVSRGLWCRIFAGGPGRRDGGGERGAGGAADGAAGGKRLAAHTQRDGAACGGAVSGAGAVWKRGVGGVCFVFGLQNTRNEMAQPASCCPDVCVCVCEGGCGVVCVGQEMCEGECGVCRAGDGAACG
eukprot:56255-Chlamydomonas_euryale.AAC.1